MGMMLLSLSRWFLVELSAKITLFCKLQKQIRIRLIFLIPV